MNIEKEFIDTVIRGLRYYKGLADKTFTQLSDKEFHYQYNDTCNSIAIIIQHMHGNMMSRWTNFLSEDGEKSWRQRDAEFEEQDIGKERLIALWNEGWNCFFDALLSIKPGDLLKTITIRKEELSVMDAINRQLAHYSYHIGQIIYIGKILKDGKWENLSIPKGFSKQYVQGNWAKDKEKKA
jgi:hypothetical protein